MGFVDRVFSGLDDCIYTINEWFGRTVWHYCVLETAAGDHVLTASDGSLCTILKVSGSLKMQSAAQWEDSMSHLGRQLHTRLSKQGHIVQIVIDYNPDYVADELTQKTNPSRVTASNLGFEAVESIFDDWVDSVSNWCATENIYIALWTKSDVLPPKESRQAKGNMRRKNTKTAPPTNRFIQNVGVFLEDIINEHNSFVDTMIDSFTTIGINAHILTAHDAIREIRTIIDKDFTGDSWAPVLPGDPIPVRFHEPGTADKDMRTVLYPSLREQIFPREAENLTQQIIRIGDKLHAPMVMALPPQTPRPFDDLFRRLREKKFPWRASFFLDADGLKYMRLKSILATVLHFTSTTNKKFNMAMQELKDLELQGESIIRFRASFCTSCYADEPEAERKLSVRSASLASAVQSWGTTDVSQVVGDPLLGFSSTVPGIMMSHPAPSCAAPLQEVLHMLPLNRPSSPWSGGSIMLRTPDGKIMPFHPISSEQASWIDIGVAPMGGGKSVWLNTINFGFLFQPGLSRLPFLSIIDIGPSSSGLIGLLQSLLPDDKKHLAAYHRLKMDENFAINPFDTPLGCRAPMPQHLSFLVNILALFATPLDQTAPQDGVAGLARACTESAYDEFHSDNNPKMYTPKVEPKIDQLLKDEGVEIDDRSSWWEVVDALFEKGFAHEAIIAQKYAVPLLSEVAGIARREDMTSMYKHKTPSGEPITEFFWRSCVESISNYPIFKEPTRFDIGDSQVVSLDLDEVAPRGGPVADRQTGVMYMVARHVCASRFFMMPTDVQYVPQMFRDYHTTRIEAIRQDPKRLCYDETHRVSRNDSVSGQIVADLETSARESRKWNLSIGLYSQSIQDYPDALIEFASNIFILGTGTVKTVDDLCKRFGLNEKARQSMKFLGKPGRAGANMIGVFKTSKGEAIQLITSTIGAKALWAFSSTTEDMAVRNRLYETMGVKRTLDVLAAKYPGGVKDEIQRRRELVMDKRGQAVNYIDEVYKELLLENR